MIKLVLATNNKNKLTELKKMLSDIAIELYSIADFPEIGEIVEDGTTFKENAAKKALTVAQATGMYCLADDSGLQVDYLAGAPGVHSARFAGEEKNDRANNAKLLQLLDGIAEEKRTARFRCVIALADRQQKLTYFEGTCEGLILDKPRGNNGFGYDPLFYLPQMGKSMAELSMVEKNSLSHRGKALAKAEAVIRQISEEQQK